MGNYNRGILQILKSRAIIFSFRPDNTQSGLQWHDAVPALKSMIEQMHPNHLSGEDMKNGKKVHPVKTNDIEVDSDLTVCLSLRSEGWLPMTSLGQKKCQHLKCLYKMENNPLPQDKRPPTGSLCEFDCLTFCGHLSIPDLSIDISISSSQSPKSNHKVGLCFSTLLCWVPQLLRISCSIICKILKDSAVMWHFAALVVWPQAHRLRPWLLS